MASGKSLALAAIQPKPPSPICICGGTWSDHWRKDGKGLLAKYQDKTKHFPKAAGQGLNRAQRRAARHG